MKGKLVPQLGGGICQVGTTLFNTAFFAGVPIPDRENHSFYISHYPKGRDATVSWGGPDLKWKNDTKNWILVSVSYTDESITISFYGTDPGYDVAYTTGPFTNETPYPTEKIKDPTLKSGLKIVEESGLTGRKCVVVRTVVKGRDGRAQGHLHLQLQAQGGSRACGDEGLEHHHWDREAQALALPAA